MIPTLSAPEQAHRSGIICDDLCGIKDAADRLLKLVKRACWNRTGAALPSLSSMKVKLEALHLTNTTLLPEALTDAPCCVGSLVIEDWPQCGMFGRCIRQARFLEMTSPTTLRDIIPPLFEPQIVTTKDNQMTVHGYQIHVDAETGAIRHYARSWVLRAVTDE